MIRACGNAINPFGAEASQFLNAAVRRNTKEPAIISAGYNMITINRHAKNHAFMRLCYSVRQAGTEKPYSPISKPYSNAIR